MVLMGSVIHGGGGGAVGHSGEEEEESSSSSSSACAICGETDQQIEGSIGDQSGDAGAAGAEESFALRCNSCRRWYHPWCMGYQLDLGRSCLITASEVEIPIDSAGVPLVCQWFCDACASTVTGVVAATAARRQRQRAGSNRCKDGLGKQRKMGGDVI
eukprot:g7587.t1